MSDLELTKSYLEKSLDISLSMETRIKYTLWHLKNVTHVESVNASSLDSYNFAVLPANGPKAPANDNKDEQIG